jgi:hypothetical protein
VTWECGECGARWPEAVPTCIDCLVRDRDGAVNALAEVARERDSWRKVAREYETALADRGLL